MNPLSQYLSKQLKNIKPPFQWKITIDPQKQMLELLMHLRIKNEAGVYLQDASGTTSDEAYFHIEEKICFYNKDSQLSDPENYLWAYAIDLNRGVEEGLVDALIKQLKIQMNELTVELHQFVNRAEAETFIPYWNETNLEHTLQTLKATGRYSTERLMIDFKTEKHTLESLKGEKDDSVERI